jgi:hypothetical protein
VAVAVRFRPSFDGCVRRDRVGAGIGLVGVPKGHRDTRLVAGYGCERDPDGRALPRPRSEVGMQAVVAPDAANNGSRAGVHGDTIDPQVPVIVAGEDAAVRSAGKRMTSGCTGSKGGDRAQRECERRGAHQWPVSRRPITNRCIWLVPSTICKPFASRM